jgi:putative chitinase
MSKIIEYIKSLFKQQNTISTKQIDRAMFFRQVQNHLGKLTEEQVKYIDLLLDFMLSDPKLTDYRHIAYILATVKHETAGTYRSDSKEVRQGKTDTERRRKVRALQDRYWYSGYYGRSYPHLTWHDNYKKAEEFVRLDYPQLLKQWETRTGKVFDLTVGDQPNDKDDPDNVLDPEIGYAVLASGMIRGWFTGFKLSDHINDKKADYVGARRTVNGVDQALSISSYAHSFAKALKAAGL